MISLETRETEGFKPRRSKENEMEFGRNVPQVAAEALKNTYIQQER